MGRQEKIRWVDQYLSRAGVSDKDRRDLVEYYGIKPQTIDKLLAGGVPPDDLADVIELKQATAFTRTDISSYAVVAEASVLTMIEMYGKANGDLDTIQAWINEAHERMKDSSAGLYPNALRRHLDTTLIDVMNNPCGDD